jgi:O-antigen/teichoic acid export membrane protein
MHSLVVRDVARAPDETATCWAAAVTLKLALLGPAVLVLGAVPLLSQRPADTTLAVGLLGLAIALQSFVELAVAIFTGYERLELELSLRLVEKICLLGIGVTGLLLGGGLAVVCAAFAAAAAVSLALGLALVHRRLAPIHRPWRPAAAGSLMRALSPVALAFVLAFATTRLVPLVVALLGGDVAAGHFGAAVRVLDVAAVLPVAVVAAVYPVLARIPPAGPAFRQLVRQAAELLLLGGLAVTLTLGLGAEWLTRTAYGEAYAPAAPLLAVLGGAAALSFLNYLLGFVFLALDRPRRLLGVAGASLAVSLACTPLLVRGFGAAGGAWALVLVEAAALAGGLAGLRRDLGVPFGPGALRIVTAAAGAAVAGTLVPAGGPWPLSVGLVGYAAGLVALRPLAPGAWQALGRALQPPRP